MMRTNSSATPFYARAASICGLALLATLSHAQEPAVSISRFRLPFDTGKLIYAYPAVTVESSAWSSSFAAAPAPRSMPTAISVQSSVWSSSFAPTPPPEPRDGASVPPAPEPERPAAKKPPTVRKKAKVEEEEPAPPKKKAAPKPEPELEPEKPVTKKKAPAPKKRAVVEEEPEPPKYRSKPALREPEPEIKEMIEKEILPPAPEPSLVHVSGTAGYYSHYIFRGLDVAYRTGIDQNNESAFFGASAAVSIGNFAVGFWYLNSLESYVPGGAAFDGTFGNPNNPLDFKSPQDVRYQEYDLFANYTFRLTEDLSLTAGLNFYWFNDGRFWAQGSQHVNNTIEVAASLNWTGIPYVNQTVNYYYDFDAFTGGYLEYKAAMRPLELYKNGEFAIGISPNFSISYDFRYNGTTNGWNNFEPGVDIPIRLSEGLSLNLGARYSWDLGDSSVGANGQAVDRTDDRFWFSATMQYTFPTAESSTPAFARREGGSIIPDVALASAERGGWRVSAGAGLRSIHSNFKVGGAKPYDINSLFERQAGGGDLGLATRARDAHYLDGSVYSNTSTWFLGAFPYGTANFGFDNQSQLARHGDGINRQIIYHSERYDYDEKQSGGGYNETDDDQIVYPYLSLSREIMRRGPVGLSIGLGYSYSRSETDSGVQLTGLQVASQSRDEHFFIYDIDELFGSQSGPFAPFDNQFNTNGANYQALIFNGPAYTLAAESVYNGIGIPLVAPLASPQHGVITDVRELVRVAAFSGSKLEADMHTLALPIDLEFNITDRIQVRVSAGPTFNLFDIELQTDTYYQQLDPLGGSSSGDLTVATHASPYDSVTGNTLHNNVLGGALNQGSAANLSAGGAQLSSSGGDAASSQGAAGGGKGSVGGTSRKLPGRTLAHEVHRNSGQHFELGVFGQLAVTLDLDSVKRWFVEAYARYDYVPTFDVSDGATSVTIDASSWGAGIGLGFRF